jgi:hypothetical protein
MKFRARLRGSLRPTSQGLCRGSRDFTSGKILDPGRLSGSACEAVADSNQARVRCRVAAANRHSGRDLTSRSVGATSLCGKVKREIPFDTFSLVRPDPEFPIAWGLAVMVSERSRKEPQVAIPLRRAPICRSRLSAGRAYLQVSRTQSWRRSSNFFCSRSRNGLLLYGVRKRTWCDSHAQRSR